MKQQVTKIPYWLLKEASAKYIVYEEICDPLPDRLVFRLINGVEAFTRTGRRSRLGPKNSILLAKDELYRCVLRDTFSSLAGMVGYANEHELSFYKIHNRVWWQGHMDPILMDIDKGPLEEQRPAIKKAFYELIDYLENTFAEWLLVYKGEPNFHKLMLDSCEELRSLLDID